MMVKENKKNSRNLFTKIVLVLLLFSILISSLMIVSANFLDWWNKPVQAKTTEYPPNKAHDKVENFILSIDEGDNYVNISGDMKINGTLFVERICFSGDCRTDLPDSVILTNICPDGMTASFDVNGDLTKCIE